MLPSTIIRTCPSADNDFQPLSEYEAQTPDTFYGAKPVLHYHDEHIKAWASADQHESLYFFSKGPEGSSAPINPSIPECYALDDNIRTNLVEEKVEVFVASDKLTIFSHKSGTGIEIPYPAITLHGVKTFSHIELPKDPNATFCEIRIVGVYMQLEFSSSAQDDDDESPDPIELTLVPCHRSPEEIITVSSKNSERTTALFNQISACSNLHPDPQDEEEEGDDEEGGISSSLPPPVPGSSGWVTADNWRDFLDEDGNWLAPSEEPGDGAGRVRGRDEVEQDGMNGQENGDDIDSKRQRTE
ncbi:regulator of volume decrease after cellular swelling-domain-containing protein [Hypoxylon sp. NC1633]|nr:regulator of volume decrease after cellular swelling-domain-containing protein [Hypoxylon sp. NC1633]